MIVKNRTRWRVARVRKGLFQSELAAKVGVSQPFMSLIENGYRVPTPEQARAIEHVLGVPISELT